MVSPSMRILQGPSGTGKTYQASRTAVKIIDGNVSNNAEEFNQRHAELVAQGRIRWVTFHPSYSYEDFVEGYRPTDSDGQISYEVRNGPFKEACFACQLGNAPPHSLFSVGEHIGAGGRYEILMVDEGGVAVRSDVSRSDAVGNEIFQYADFWTVLRLIEFGVKEEELSPSGQQADQRRDLQQRTGLASTLFTNPGPLRAVFNRIQEAGTSEEYRSVVLIIDEINRADLSRVFGELMTLLEQDKRIGAPEARSIILPYSGDSFSVPHSLSIIGTMNTSDRSLALMDVALRRRFEFVEVLPDPELCPADYGGIPVRLLLRQWNRRIEVLLSRDLQIGHSELMEGALERVRTQHGWDPDDAGKNRAFASTLRHKILPQLIEHFYQDWRRMRVVLGIPADSPENELLNPTDLGDVLNLAPEAFDEDQSESFTVPTWWDPASEIWDAELFSQALRFND